MARRVDFSERTMRNILVLLDNEETMSAIAEVLSAECRSQKEFATQEALSGHPELSKIVMHEAKAKAWSEFVSLMRDAAGLKS